MQYSSNIGDLSSEYCLKDLRLTRGCSFAGDPMINGHGRSVFITGSAGSVNLFLNFRGCKTPPKLSLMPIEGP